MNKIYVNHMLFQLKYLKLKAYEQFKTIAGSK